MNQLPHTIDGPFVTRQEPGSPVVTEDAPGLRLALTDVAHADGALAFTLLLTFGFPDPFYTAFKKVQKAIVLELQDPATGRAVAFPLIDPTINELAPSIRNFAPPAPDAAPAAFLRAYTGLRLMVPGDADLQLFARAVLHGHRSNVVRVEKKSA